MILKNKLPEKNMCPMKSQTVYCFMKICGIKTSKAFSAPKNNSHNIHSEEAAREEHVSHEKAAVYCFMKSCGIKITTTFSAPKNNKSTRNREKVPNLHTLI